MTSFHEQSHEGTRNGHEGNSNVGLESMSWSPSELRSSGFLVIQPAEGTVIRLSLVSILRPI